MAAPSREQALPLLAAANNHGDLAVKLSSLKQAKDILLSMEPWVAAELFPFLVELQSSPEFLVRKYLLEVIGEINIRALKYTSILLPILLAFLKDDNSGVAKQAIIIGTQMFCNVLEELTKQFQRQETVERWLQELWTLMVKFKDAVFGSLFEAGSVGKKLLALKFVETYILLFSSDTNDFQKSPEVSRHGRRFNISWLVGHHPVLDTGLLISDANRSIGILVDLLHSASNLPGSMTIAVVNSLAAIARRRPAHYNGILSILLGFDPNFETVKGRHAASIQYSLRTAFLGFLRCSHPSIIESRERLVKTLRAMNAGDAADQVLRQVEKMMRNNDRASRDTRSSKDEQQTNHVAAELRKRLSSLDGEDPNNGYEVASKRLRFEPNNTNLATQVVDRSDSVVDYVNGMSPKVSVLNNNLTPVEQMIAMIGALIAEGERGVESLEILVSQLHPDLLADIVITNMKHLPNTPPPLARLGNMSSSLESESTTAPAVVAAPNGSVTSVNAPILQAQGPISSSNAASFSDTSTAVQLSDSKRDPRRDPRRLDPRRVTIPTEVPSVIVAEDDRNSLQSDLLQSDNNASDSSNHPTSLAIVSGTENMLVVPIPKTEAHTDIVESVTEQSVHKVEYDEEEAKECFPDTEIKASMDIPLSSVNEIEQEQAAQPLSDVSMMDESYSPPLPETDEFSPGISKIESPEDQYGDLPMLPSYVGLTEVQEQNVRKLAVEHIICSYKNLKGADCKQMGMALLARLVAQMDADDDVNVIIQKHIISDYQQQKGHELIMHVLYHLHSLIISDSEEYSSSGATLYENFLLGVAKSLLDNLPASDKSFSRLLGEVPWLPDSLMRLLDGLCCDNHAGKDGRDGDRITQGLGAVWSLILGRPCNRHSLLDIALKCAVHPHDEVRARAIRLVANKLYVLNDISEIIEQFATNAFLSAVENRFSDIENTRPGTSAQRAEHEVGSRETSISGSISEREVSENDSMKTVPVDHQSDSSVSFAQAQQHISLFFALCTKKSNLLQLVFDNYAHAPKAVKQALHRHIPVLMKAIGSSYLGLLHIISDPPKGSENLLTQVLHTLCEGTTPPRDLIAAVKQLYETKLKDAAILIPVLSSFSKSEVLPIFPRLVELPLDKFQAALAHILQGSAHTGPALTPTEVLVAIHDITPERDGLPLKKITDACSACFEQRTVFTQQVLAKALNQMIDQTPVPLLFMRTVIQAIDAFPTLVDFVMEILSKLVNRQVWKMPKLWVGFLKCVSQTQPHSFRVLLQLPPPQLESTLNKYANLRVPLAAFANHPAVKNSVPRPTLALLGLTSEPNLQQPHVTSALHASDTSSSVHNATLT